MSVNYFLYFIKFAGVHSELIHDGFPFLSGASFLDIRSIDLESLRHDNMLNADNRNNSRNVDI